MDLPFQLLKVFSVAGRPLSGNPLCVFPDAATLCDEEMLAWARRLDLRESTFVTSPGDGPPGEAGVRTFTPDHEMPSAGHPALGTAHVGHGTVPLGIREA